MKILQVLTDTNRRGAQVFAMDLGKELADRGHSILTVALRQGLDSSRLEIDTLGRTRYGFATLRALRRLMKAADVTIGHGSDTAFACATGKLGSRSPYVYRQISNIRYWSSTPLRRLRSMITMRLPNQIVALSTSDRDDLTHVLRISEKRITLISNAVNERKFEPASIADKARLRSHFQIPDGFRVALFMGALVEEKGCSTAISAVKRLGGTILLIAGSGAFRDSLVAEAAGDESVRFLATVDEPRDALALADVLLLPSWTESQPAVLIEAGLMGVPSIATNVGSIPEIVVDGVTGLLVPVRGVEEMVEALRRIFSDDALAQRMGAAARRHCLESFSIGSSATRWEELLISVSRPADPLGRYGQWGSGTAEITAR